MPRWRRKSCAGPLIPGRAAHQPSSPADAGDPALRGVGDQTERPRRTGSPAFAEDDGRGRGCPTGKSLKTCLAQVAKIFRFPSCPNQTYTRRRLAPSQRGVSRSSRTLVRDAMDAGLSKDERQASRTAKPYGPGAPTLASSFVELIHKATVANKPGHRGECGISRKTIACGNAGLIRWTCGDYTRVLSIIRTRGCGCIATRHSPRPQGAEVLSELGRIAPRECGHVSPPSLRGAKRRSNPRLRLL
jgi:hypothetical protein